MCRSLPPTSSIRFNRSLNESAIRFSPLPRLQNLVNGFAGHFLERGHAGRNLDQSAAPERQHAALDGLFLEFNRARSHQHQFLDLVVHFHDFVQASAALVPGVVTSAAPFALGDLHGRCFFRREAFLDQGLHRDLDLLRAFLAEAPYQALCTNQVHGSRYQEGFNAHVHESGDGFRRTVGVQGGKHQVAGESSLDGDFRGLEVADLAHQDDVGVLPQEGTQGGGKVQPDLLFHLHLVDADQLELHRVFGGHDVGVGYVQAGDGGIQGVGLARARGPGDQHHAVGLENGLFELDQRFRLETQLGHIEPQVLLVEQPQHDFFAPQRRQRADSEVELLLLGPHRHFQHDAAVLGQPLFADVELRHNLHARGNGVFQLERRRHDRLQHTVNAEAYAKFLFVGLHVNIAGAALDGVGEHQVHQLHDGSLVGRLLQVGQVHLLLFRLQFDVAVSQVGHRLHDLLQVILLAASVSLFDAGDNRAFRRHHRLDIEAGHELDVVHGKDVGGIHHGDGERSSHAAQGKNLVTLGGFKGNQLDHRRIDFEIGEIDGGNAVLPGEEVGHVLIVEEAQLHQSRSQTAVRLFLDLGRLLQLLWGNDLFLHQEVTQPLRHASISYLRGRETAVASRDCAALVEGEFAACRVDTNCQRRWNTAPVT